MVFDRIRQGNDTKRIAFFSDCHTGSLLGLVPRKFVDTRRWNPGLTWLWARYQEFLDNVPELDVLALVGDLTDGAQKADRGRESWTTDPILQEEAVLELLDPLIKKVRPGGRIVAARGTRYHEGAYGRHAEEIARDIGCEKMPDGSRSAWHVPIEIGGCKFSIAHPISFAPVNVSSPLYAEMAAAANQPARKRPDVIIRGHVHRYIHVETADPTMHAFTLPSFELRTAYMESKNIYRGGDVHVGGLWLEIGPEGQLIYQADKHLRAQTVPMPDFMELSNG